MDIAYPQLTASNNQPSQLSAFIILLAMLLAAGAAVLLKPTQIIAEQQAKINLETMVPKQFGDWRIDDSIKPILASAEVRQELGKIYNQLLSRTYMNTLGQKVMLSIAYGSNQGNDELQVHRPEFCYKAQGFELHSVVDDMLITPAGAISVKRLEATQGLRIEPITYWIVIGEKATLPGIGRKLTQLKYGLTGKVPDGMLVRISSIMGDRQTAYLLQDTFINEMLKAMNPISQIKMIGEI